MSTANLPAMRACRPAGNKGPIVGRTRPLQPERVWAIRVRLEIARRARELAHLIHAIDSRRRGCNLVRLEVAEVRAAGQARHGAAIFRSFTRRCEAYRVPGRPPVPNSPLPTGRRRAVPRPQTALRAARRSASRHGFLKPDGRDNPQCAIITWRTAV